MYKFLQVLLSGALLLFTEASFGASSLVLFRLPNSEWTEVRQLVSYTKIPALSSQTKISYRVVLKFYDKLEYFILNVTPYEEKNFIQKIPEHFKNGRMIDLTGIRFDNHLNGIPFYLLGHFGWYANFQSYSSYFPSFTRIFGHENIQAQEVLNRIQQLEKFHKPDEKNEIFKSLKRLQFNSAESPRKCLLGLTRKFLQATYIAFEENYFTLPFDVKILPTSIEVNDSENIVQGNMELLFQEKKVGVLTLPAKYKELAPPSKSQDKQNFSCSLAYEED